MRRPDRITPMMRQYFGAKDSHPGCVLFFRMGDFYEMFYDDAVVVARELDLTLTSRDKDGDNPVPMAGVPWHAARGYIGRLVDKGYKVAICEQMEDPAKAKGIVRREVVEVVTPGVVLDENNLDAKEANFLAALAPPKGGAQAGGPWGLAYVDISTGELHVTAPPSEASVADELGRAGVRQVVHPPDFDPAALQARLTGVFIEEAPAEAFDLRKARRALAACRDAGGGPDARARIESYGFGAGADRAVVAAGAAVAYVEFTRTGAKEHVRPPQCYSMAGTMVLDDATRTNLELFRTIREGRRRGSLLGVLDCTRTAMGARLLRRWVAYPLLTVEAIHRRGDAVEDLVGAPTLREALREALDSVSDLERLAGRICAGAAGPRDLVALRRSAEALPVLQALLGGGEAAGRAQALSDLADDVDDLSDLAALIAVALVDEPPVALKEGGVIRGGFDAELDGVVEAATQGKDWILGLQEEERRRTGIGSLKVRYNRVFGYYIEVSKPNLHLVPEDYIRKQTLANAERYYTPQLKELEERVVTAEERRSALEADLFERVRAQVAEQSARIQASAACVASMDVLSSLADLAHRFDWRRPDVDDSDVLDIEDGRHPVVERLLPAGDQFVPNSVTLSAGDRQLLVVTGPNMAGKSTVLRQTALIALLAQAGSFVPARRARVGVVDRIFTRVGASDDLARGQSTFMVEMTETASILTHATDRSLVVLDEIGRGTSTFDGVSIAWAVAEHLHDVLGCRTLFATHYHELTELSVMRDRVFNVSVAVKEWNDEVVFLRRLVDGGANRSYGIQVGRLAGLPASVVGRAKEVLANLEATQLDPATAKPAIARSASAPAERVGQYDLFAAPPPPSPVEDALRRTEVDALSPLEALNLLYELKKKV